jgi:hypothetical protein
MRCLLLFLALPLGLACSSPKNSEAPLDPNTTMFGFKLADSLMVDFLGNLQIIDYEPQTGRFLAMESTKGDILEIDKSGNILLQLNRKEGPNGYGNFIEKLGFWGPEKRVAQAVNELIIYDSEWNILQKFPVRYKPAFYMMNTVKERTSIFKTNEREVMVLNDNAIQNMETAEIHADEPFYRIWLIDLNSGEEFGAFPFPENHPYINYPKLTLGETNPIWTQIDNKIVLKMQYSDFIEIYDLHTLSLKEQVPVSTLTDIPLVFGLTDLRPHNFDVMFNYMKERQKRGNLNPTKLNFKIGGKVINLLSINPPIPAQYIDPIEPGNFQEFNKIALQHNKTLYLPILNGQKAGMAFPKEFKGFAMLSFDNTKILTRLLDSEMEYEPDMLTYYIYELVVVK